MFQYASFDNPHDYIWKKYISNFATQGIPNFEEKNKKQFLNSQAEGYKMLPESEFSKKVPHTYTHL